MKQLALVAIAASLLLGSCGKNAESNVDENGVPTTSDSLRVALANQDSLLMLMNDIAAGMTQIKDMENILAKTSDLTAETTDQRQQIHDDMIAIQQTLQERRDRLAQLEKKLKASGADNKVLRQSIETLKAQIAQQEGTIETLRSELAAANIKVERLTANVDSLNTQVATVTEEKQQAQAQSEALTNELNTVYYAVGSKKELKEHKLIETGFLRKTKVMPADFQQSYFTRGDRRTLSTIDTHSRKAKVITSQPADSYEITTDAAGNKVLHITNAQAFWTKSNFLIIEVD